MAAPLWSDYSGKQRWIAIPNGQRITFNAEGSWRFPVGTILVKHFGMEMVAGDPAQSSAWRRVFWSTRITAGSVRPTAGTARKLMPACCRPPPVKS
ncbi:MAG: hypothetical protein R3F47_07400 [Gammaproteobacteria bacterium]